MQMDKASCDGCGCWSPVKRVPKLPSLPRQSPNQTSEMGGAPLSPHCQHGVAHKAYMTTI